MDKRKIEMMLSLDVPVEPDAYADSVVEILRRPEWYHPIERRKFDKQFPKRVHIVLAEYARELISNINRRG